MSSGERPPKGGFLLFSVHCVNLVPNLMPVFLKDLLENPHLLKRTTFEKACSCTPGGTQTFRGPACTHCHYDYANLYDSLGDEIERHPPGSAGFRRG